MACYKLYIIEPGDRVADVVELDCSNDRQAMEVAALYPDRRSMVLRREGRKVWCFSTLERNGSRSRLPARPMGPADPDALTAGGAPPKLDRSVHNG
jgi:hypothetical protein